MDPPKVQTLVRIQVGILCLASVMDARRSSEPSDGVRLLDELLEFSECGGFARDPAKVEDQVRFLARTLVKTPEPDGQATGCNPVEVGSTPTGVSDQPTAGLDYIFMNERIVSEPSPRWKVFIQAQLPVGITS